MKSLTCFSSRSRGTCCAVILERLAENCRGRTTAIICTRKMLPNIFWSRTDYISGAYVTKMVAISSPALTCWLVFVTVFIILLFTFLKEI